MAESSNRDIMATSRPPQASSRRWAPVSIVLAAVLCLGLACSGGDQNASGEPSEVVVSSAVPVGEITVMDVYRPSEGTDLPLLVLLHGTGTGGRAEMGSLARAMAERGVVVFVPTWKVIEERPEWPMPDAEVYRVQTEAVVCTLRHARRTAEDYGGSPDRLGLMGHSGGALAGIRAALVDEPPWPGMDCDDGVDHRPDVFIGTGGDYSGRYQFVATAGDLYDPHDPELLSGGNSDLVVQLMHGIRDNNVDSFDTAETYEWLLEAGYDVAYTLLDTRHGALIWPDGPVGQFVVDRVVALLGAGGGTDGEYLDAELAFDGTCSYSGPNTLEPAERLAIRLYNTSDAPVFFIVYNIEDVELGVALAGGGTMMPAPAYVDTGSGLVVPAGADRLITLAFVDQPYQWVLACVDNLESVDDLWFGIGPGSLIHPTAGLAPTDLG